MHSDAVVLDLDAVHVRSIQYSPTWCKRYPRLCLRRAHFVEATGNGVAGTNAA